ncbi:MAG TPA: hypothetical protein VII53_09735 [Solirubrobacteraceae bacterium]
MSVKPVSLSFEPHPFPARRLATFAVPLIVALMCAISASAAQAELTIESFSASVTSTDAGAHPDASSRFSFASSVQGEQVFPNGGLASDLVLKLPPGFVADPQAVSQCSPSVFYGPPAYRPNNIVNEFEDYRSACPADSQIGVAEVVASYVGNPKPFAYQAQIYMLSSGPDAPARIGFAVRTPAGFVNQEATAAVHESDNYAITLTIHEVTRLFGTVLFGVKNATFWGVPGAHERTGGGSGPPPNGSIPPEPPSQWRPFIENPTDCSETPVTTLLANTYAEPETYAEKAFTLPKPTNCQLVPFDPSISVEPRPAENPTSDSTQAGAPTGLTVELTTPQNESPSGRGTSELKEAVLTFPRGVAISPSAATGELQACTDEQFALGSDAPSACPAAALVGEDEIESPLLPGPLKGKVYLGQPLNDEPESGKMFRIFQEFQGFTLDVKLVGETTANEQTGQLEVRAGVPADGEPNLPELPFTHFRVHTRGGPGAVLVNQPFCGPSTSTATLTPYSSPTTPATLSSTFTTSYDGHGAPCPAALPFSPSSSISTGSSQAGAFSPLTLSFSRPDGSQPLGQLSVHLPPGVLGYVSAVSLCDPADAAAGACPAASRIGAVSATAGAGPEPLTVPGSAYLARGSGGYPFALSVVVPAVAGPFDLGNVVALVNLEIHNDGSLTGIVNLPSILKGVPLDIRAVTATIDRPGFIVNPTNCSPLSMGGQITSLAGTVAQISAPFQVSGCGSLPFKPDFAVASSGHTSRAGGESLTARVSQKPGEANLHSVKVELPKVLPSRLTTLQKACPEGVFYANPAACDKGSVVGTIVAYTPLLSKPLQGPAYFVSHGGAKFPELIVVLQGEGVTVEVAGETFISKTGITSSTFSAIPDVPISGFVLSLPEGPNSALAANGNPCKEKLVMPTTLVGQNGVVVKQSTKIAVSGCPKAKKAVKKKKKVTRAKKARRARKADHPHGGQRRSKR